MSQLTQQEINQRRREKILARTKKQQLQQVSLPNQQQLNQNNAQKEDQNVPFLKPSTPTNRNNSYVPSSTPKSQQNNNEPKADAFTRFRQLQAKAQRQKYLLIMAKILGVIVALIQIYLMFILKTQEIKFNNKEITEEHFKGMEQKLIDELDLMFWACFGTLVFTWIWIKFVKSAKQNNEKFEIIPGSTMVSLLEQLNKFLEYKVLVKAVLGYTFSCVVVHLLMNQLIAWLGYEDLFFKPDLTKLLKPVLQNVQNQEIM